MRVAAGKSAVTGKGLFMNLDEILIVADSSADLRELDGVGFGVAPLKIITKEKEYVDDTSLDVEKMVSELAKYKGRSSSSCPNASDWLNAFGDAKYIFCVTITATLSGSYNAAMMAKAEYEEQHPDRRVFVLNSLSAGPELKLMIDKIKELCLAGLDFDEVCEKVTEYTKSTGLLFMLESLKNFANNGRVSPIVAKAVGLLGIRMVGKASDKGDLQPLDKCRGEQKALKAIVNRLKSSGLKMGRVLIDHCFNLTAAEALKGQISLEFPHVAVEIGKCHGLCSFYAEKGGLLVGFEKF